MNGFAVMVGSCRIGADLVRIALSGALSPSRVFPAKAGTQVSRGDRHRAQLALGPRFRGDDGSFAGPLRHAYDDRIGCDLANA